MSSLTRGIAVLAGTIALAAPAANAAGRSVWTVAGTGAGCQTAPQCGDAGPATSAPVGFPQGVAVTSGGVTYIADMADNEVRRLDPDGTITVIAGDGSPCQSAPACGDGGPAINAQLNAPVGVAVDGHGDVFIADAGDDEVREVSPNGTITRIAGTGAQCANPATCGDGGSARSAALNQPDGVAADTHGDVFVADAGDQEIREVNPHGTIATVAGDGSICSAAPACGDGGSATSAQLTFPEGVAVDAHGALFIADDGDNEIRKVTGGRIGRLAGTGTACAAAPACGDGPSALRATLNAPEGVAVDAAGNVYVADWGDSEVRVISRRGAISRLAGSGIACALAPACGDTQTASAAQLNAPNGVAVDSAGDVFIADTSDDEVRVVPATTSAPVRVAGPHGGFALLAFAARATRTSVSVGALVNRRVRVSLSVSSGRGAPLLVAHFTASPGLVALAWNRRLGSRAAPRGRYTLTVAARYGQALVTSRLTVTL